MALLNKLFFPSATSTSPTVSVTAAPASSASSSTPAALVSAAATATAASATSTTAAATAAIAGIGGTVTSLASSSTSSSSSASRAWHATAGRTFDKRSNNVQSVHSKNTYLSQFPFDGRQVRVLLFRECDSNGRRLLFDSNALQKVPLRQPNGQRLGKGETPVAIEMATATTSPSPNACRQSGVSAGSAKGGKGHSGSDFVEVCAEYGYKHIRPNSADIAVIGEMVFGALAMSFRGTALKVHWLQEPSRILFSHVFLKPLVSTNGQSPYSTISMSSLVSPRTSISSEHGSIDGLSMSSFSMPFSVSVGRQLSLTPSDRSSLMTCPLDVPDQQSTLSTSTEDARADSGPRFSSTCSTGTDSGYSGISRSQLSSDQWSASYQYSTRSSLGSVLSEQSDPVRKLSMDSYFYPSAGAPPFFDALSSDGSLQRRICRNLRTSFENEHSMNDLIGFVSDTLPNANAPTNGGGSEGGSIAPPNYRRASYCANESRSNPEMGGRRRDANKPMPRRAKLGLAVCITLSESFEEEMELFCSEHVALLESMLSRLRAATERAYINHKDFLQIMFNAWRETQQWFNDLFTAPRIKSPVWLSITTSGSKYSKTVAERFIKELCWLLSFADTKSTNFFISTMLTAILTHHLGWVPTVSAFMNSTSPRSETGAAAIEQRAKLLQVSQKHPYNALWAQMGDLYGAIGLPPKLARTIVYGTEKLSIERLLNILTYFIRCGEVRRAAKRESFNKDLINSLMSQNENETLKRSTNRAGGLSKSCADGGGVSSSVGESGSGSGSGGGLTRTKTCKQHLNTISDNYELSDDSDVPDEAQLVRTLKKNEIPNVLAFRDSRFVQQELRIGNYHMDTGIEKNSLPQHQAKRSPPTLSSSNSRRQIRLTVTSPENVEMSVEDENTNSATNSTTTGSIGDGAVEAIEIDACDASGVAYTGRTSNASMASIELGDSRKKFWKWDGIQTGVSLSEHQRQQQQQAEMSARLSNSNTNCRSYRQQRKGNDAGGDSVEQDVEKRISHLSLSDLITQNSIGKSDRMTWGIEPIKENVSLEEQIHLDLCQKLIAERDQQQQQQQQQQHQNHQQHHDTNNGTEKSGRANAAAVVFVLGDDEPLVNLRKSLAAKEHAVVATAAAPADNMRGITGSTSSMGNRQQTAVAALCPLHQRNLGLTHSKKHSGVKFNFEQYPQIATNYMKNKNLVMSNYDLLMEKCSKLEAEEEARHEASLASSIKAAAVAGERECEQPAASACATKATTTTACVVCNSNSNSNSFQTPSNATELEFEADEEHCYSNPTSCMSSARTLHTVSSAASSIDTLKSLKSNSNNEIATTLTSASVGGVNCGHTNAPPDDAAAEVMASTPTTTPKKTPTYAGNNKKVSSHRGSISSVAAKCAAANEAVHLLRLPVPGIKELPQDDELLGDMKLRAGFIPSLFFNVSDHYISDMVLQGTYASPAKWEITLREDLALAARSASLISLPIENIAVVADMEKWDVRLISSQTQCFPYAGSQSAPVGMSQLVSTMLETVQAMNNSGISAYECLSFLESKLQEIYLQSETLAAFLLETDFCPLSTVTTALNLSENDVPLLLSIASIHTPQISKKCGISFR